MCFAAFKFYSTVWNMTEKYINQAQRRAAMNRCTQYIIPNESYDINHTVHCIIRHCSLKYALHIHELIYEGVF